MKRYNAKALRVGRWSQVNQIYHITFACKSREPYLACEKSAKTVVDAFDRISPEAKTLAYVVMPDHVHWLMQLTDKKTLSETVRLLKVFISHDIGSVWHKGFHDHAVRNESDLNSIIEYIRNNPVKAGLVDHIDDYPWWGVSL